MVAVDVSNKGLGPAIVGAVRYEIGDREAAGTYAIDDALREVWPELELYTRQNGTLDSTVVSPGETTRILTLVLPRAGRNDSLPRSLNEYVELAKTYSTDKSSEFVNGVLDRLLHTLRDAGVIVKEGRGLVE